MRLPGTPKLSCQVVIKTGLVGKWGGGYLDWHGWRYGPLAGISVKGEKYAVQVCDFQLLRGLWTELSVIRRCPFEITEWSVPYKPQYLSGVFKGRNSENVIKTLVKIQEGDYNHHNVW